MSTLTRAVLVSLPITLMLVGSAYAHGGDPTVLHVCIGPQGVMRAVAPQESCPRNYTAVHLGIGSPAAVSVYTVERPVDTVGPLTGSSISVSCEEGDQVLSGGYVHGGGQPDLQISGSYPANERSWIVEIQNFSETLSYQARCARFTP